MKFGFIAKHRGIWAVDWMRGARRLAGGFYAWLTRPRTRRSQSEEELGAKVRASSAQRSNLWRQAGVV